MVKDRNKRIRNFKVSIAATYNRLIELKANKDRENFNKLINSVLPTLKTYIHKRLSIAVKKGQIPENKYKLDDFVTELYIAAYDHIEEVKTDRFLYPWFIKKIDEIFKDTFVDEEFDDFFFKNIDDFTEVEWKEMEEKYWVDADGDLIMEEDLDDSLYQDHSYDLADVFTFNDEDKLIQSINDKMKASAINKTINLLTFKLPLNLRSVFELKTIYSFSYKEISRIKQIPVEEVIELLRTAKENLKSGIKKQLQFLR